MKKLSPDLLIKHQIDLPRKVISPPNKKIFLVAVSLISFLLLIGLTRVFFKPKPPPIAHKNKEIFTNHFPAEFDLSHLLTPSPISTPTPTAVPTITPTPTFSGYCLFVPILMYHHIQPFSEAEKNGTKNLTVDSDAFDRQMNYLVTNGYNTISAETLAQALVNHQALPEKAIVLTADDGYKNIFAYAFPILRKYHLTLNVMIPTGLTNNGNHLSWDDLKQMTSSGLVFAYPHTWSHINLGAVTLEKAEFEVETSKRQLEENLGKAVHVFCYPYGFISQNALTALSANGFIAGLSTTPGFYQCDSFIMTLHRTRIGNAPLSSYGL